MSIRKITDTRKWLLNIAAKVLAREFKADPSILTAFQDKFAFWFDWYEKRK